MKLARRQFIRDSASAGGAAALTAAIGSGWLRAAPSAPPDPQTDGERVVPSFCELCFWKCGVLAHVKHGRVTKVVGNPEHPLSRGKLCPRGVGATGLLYDPDRLKQPLLRVESRFFAKFRGAWRSTKSPRSCSPSSAAMGRRRWRCSLTDLVAAGSSTWSRPTARRTSASRRTRSVEGRARPAMRRPSGKRSDRRSRSTSPARA
jgi:anaerobic selenocysteine-containing dehydrogenase